MNTEAMTSIRSPAFKVFIAMATGYRQSPRNLATTIALNGPKAWQSSLVSCKRACVYRQSSHSDSSLKRGLRLAASAVSSKLPYATWTALEMEMAEQVRQHCGGTLERFAARQAAADMTQESNWVAGHDSGNLPALCPVGPGAEVGHWHSEAAEGSKHCAMPQTLPFLEQTAKCEYGK